MYRAPIGTYRLQFNAGFTFADARRIAAYLAELGVSDLYTSPILKARRGSTHGYDIVDPTALNPELGTDDDFEELHVELRRLELGLLLDIVPNHMAASEENAWWVSVLENGPNSRFVHYFDIDWSPVTAHGTTANKLLLPILGKPYGEALESREITLGFDADGFYFRYYEHRLPLAPDSYRRVLRECVDALPTEGVGMELHELVAANDTVPNSKFLKETLSRLHEQEGQFRLTLDATIERFNGTAGDADSFNDLDALLDAQWYRLAYWRIASEKINYRRFFDVTDLIGVRVENPEVFEARNRRVLELVAEQKVTGLRIDHIDGLHDPLGHMRKLQLRLGSVEESDDASAPENFYVVVEKILTRGEELRPQFPVAGTTGYDFIDAVNALFLDNDGLQRLSAFYRSFAGETKSFAEIGYERKKQIIHDLFSGEMRALGKQLSALALLDRNARDFAPAELLAALTEITAEMDVYRTYIRDFNPPQADRSVIRAAIERARGRRGVVVDYRLFRFLELVLLINPPSYLSGERERWLAFVMRWQQFTGRVMAKGVEDTAFYNYNRLISMNEVGGDPGREPPFDALAEFHARNERFLRDWPDSLNATSTHDTKRGEDVRVRIDVLSEIAETWEREVRRWSRLNAPLRSDGIPPPNEELFVYQTLMGMWPTEGDDIAGVSDRLKQYLEKASREAKTQTNWLAVNPDYEEALLRFAEALLSNDSFMTTFLRLQKRVAFYGFLNGLSQLVLKITSPGVPDFYQGTETWDLSLVDPDNRRPVDYEEHQSMLRKLKSADSRDALDVATLLRRWFDGRVKLFVTWKALGLRRKHVDAFRHGAYTAVDTGTPHVCAFLRGESIAVAVPRLLTRLVKPGTLPLGDVWNGFELRTGIDSAWRNVFTGEMHSGQTIPLPRVFASFPVAILERV